jgi:uncharacterized protein YdbL (DUF1318 family)
VALSEDQKAMLRLLAQREQGYDDIAALTGSSVEEVRAKVKGAIAGLDGSLSGDQKAMLRLLAQREEGYDDIAALTGSSVEDVRAKVGNALTGLDAEAAAGERPAAPEKVPEPPPPPPEQRPAPTPTPPAATRPAARKPAPGGLKLPEDKGVRRALAAGCAVVLVIVLLLVTGVLGDDDSSDSAATTTGGESALNGGEKNGTSIANGAKEPTEAILEPVDGGDGQGQALFGRTGQKVVVLFGAKGLQQAPQGETYTVSLIRSASERLPLIATSATKSGIISGRFEVAPQVLGLLASGFDTMELSIVPNDELRTALAQARKSKKAPDYGGTAVLRGTVTGPIVEAGEEED